MPQEDCISKDIKKCRSCKVLLTDINKVTKQNLCRTCNSRNCKNYKIMNKDKISKYNKSYKSSHVQEIKKYNCDYNINNRDSIQKRHTPYLKKKRQTDINYKIAVNCRNKIKKMIKTNSSSLSLLGCDSIMFKKWLEFNFNPGMTFDNYGFYWHIDHVIPCYHFNLENELHKNACFNWSNVQPLEATKNLSKKNKLNTTEALTNLSNVFDFAKQNKLTLSINNKDIYIELIFKSQDTTYNV